MKNLFRLCAGGCSDAAYQPPSHKQVSPSLSFYFYSQPEFKCTKDKREHRSPVPLVFVVEEIL